jgi:hypothetical protein
MMVSLLLLALVVKALAAIFALRLQFNHGACRGLLA